MLLVRDLLLAGVFGSHVARRGFRRRKAQEAEIHTTSHFDHEKRIARFSISTHACGSLPIVMVFLLATLRAAGDQTVLHPKSCSSRRPEKTCSSTLRSDEIKLTCNFKNGGAY